MQGEIESSVELSLDGCSVRRVSWLGGTSIHGAHVQLKGDCAYSVLERPTLEVRI